MNKNVIITLKGRQKSDGNVEPIEFVTEGSLLKRETGFRISYEETEITGLEGTTTTLDIEKNTVTLTRSGLNNSTLVFEKGKKYMGHYDTQYGGFTIGVISSNVDVAIDEFGGKIEICYTVEIDNHATSSNDFILTVKEAQSNTLH